MRLILLLLALLPASASWAQHAFRLDNSKAVNDQVRVFTPADFTIENAMGPVDVRVGDGDKIRIEATYSGGGYAHVILDSPAAGAVLIYVQEGRMAATNFQYINGRFVPHPDNEVRASRGTVSLKVTLPKNFVLDVNTPSEDTDLGASPRCLNLFSR